MSDTALRFAVIMERRQIANKWADEQWEAIGVVPDSGQADAAPRLIVDDPARSHWLASGFELRLYRDEAENYLLNVMATEPRIFVMWRMEQGLAKPVLITASYGEAARMLDSGEQVDGVPMPPEVREWVEAFAREHYRPVEKGGRYADQRREAKQRERR